MPLAPAIVELINELDASMRNGAELDENDRISLRELQEHISTMCYPQPAQDSEHQDFEHWLGQCGVIRVDGSFDQAQARRELQDYHMLLGEVPKVYDHVTRGRITKPNTLAEEVIHMADEVMDDEIMRLDEDAES